MTPKGEKGNGRTHERRSGLDRRTAVDPAYDGPERRRSGLRRRSERSPDKPIKR
jgi:hypothetical protein